MWFSYKHHNTLKFLIGITPQGVISYTCISHARGGHTNNKYMYLTEHCGLLRNLLPGDVVLVDCGFDVSESVGIHVCQSSICLHLRRGRHNFLPWK